VSWLCQCGNGSLAGKPPDFCPVCGFDFEAHFGPIDDEPEEDEEEDLEDEEDTTFQPETP
jgi:hypothetical protein